ncbi:MAG: electron transfer flavoprotein subunit alpha/FixB family protein [Peptococcaceae bacterium]|jgi:electron transfer flavoprotein alpha subunit|nr:electron transfer flavoprotein subunit alpha/FixB family protein [Peptococcaceae bacterium]MDH7524381.1 electron transfer flavoprotein subunit alpha/FixB family protein [Peptococcaceae bacterium]
MSSGAVCVFAEHFQGNVKKYSLEKINKAKQIAAGLGAETAVLVCGNRLDKVARDLAGTGVTKVYAFDHPSLEMYQPLLYADLLAGWAREEKPEIMWFSSSSIGADLASRVAAKLETGLTAHCVDLDLEEIDGKKIVVHSLPGWGGNFMVKIICPEKRPQMATVRSGICEAAEISSESLAQVIKVPVTVKEELLKIRAVEEVHDEAASDGLETAEVVVAGGWGMRSAGSLDLLKQLAKTLKAEIGGTRPLVDCGWVEESRMIGVSGKTVSPRLFISVGASGQPHYTTGFDKAGAIVCINNDPAAPLFEMCDVGIVGDARRVLPELIAQLEAAL